MKRSEGGRISALPILIEAELEQRCCEQGLHRLKRLLLPWIRPPWPFLKVKAHGAMEQANSFKIQIELKGGAGLTHSPIVTNTATHAATR